MKRLLIISALGLAAGSAALAADAPKATYVPGLGEFMTLTQIRHAKLWFAGSAANWALAQYELDEIKEGLDDAAAIYPEDQGIPVGAMIQQNIEPPLAELAKVITAKNVDAFKVSFDRLSEACNTCHSGAGHAFIQIQRPTAPPATNQIYAPN